MIQYTKKKDIKHREGYESIASTPIFCTSGAADYSAALNYVQNNSKDKLRSLEKDMIHRDSEKATAYYENRPQRKTKTGKSMDQSMVREISTKQSNLKVWPKVMLAHGGAYAGPLNMDKYIRVSALNTAVYGIFLNPLGEIYE